MTTPQEAITAESVLSKFDEQFMNRAIDCSDNYRSYILKAMEEYAQQYSLQQNKSEVRGREIEFLSWAGHHAYKNKSTDENWYFFLGSPYYPSDHKSVTISELYQLFLSSNPIAVEGEALDLENTINLIVRENENHIMDELACEETTAKIMESLRNFITKK